MNILTKEGYVRLAAIRKAAKEAGITDKLDLTRITHEGGFGGIDLEAGEHVTKFWPTSENVSFEQLNIGTELEGIIGGTHFTEYSELVAFFTENKFRFDA